MKLTTPLSALAGVATTAVTATPLDDNTPPVVVQQTPLLGSNNAHLFSNPAPDSAATVNRIPTSYESAVQGRRILALSPLATLSTVFPASYASPTEDADGLPHSVLMEHRPAGLGGVPIGLMDYIADCEGDDDEGNPTILAIKIATSFKNVEAGSNMSISVNWVPRYLPSKRIESSPTTTSRGFLQRLKNWLGLSPTDDDDDDDANLPDYDPVPYSAANLPRFSLLGYLERIPIDSSSSDGKAAALQSCFLKYHPDARYWLPGNRIHESEWVRLVVTQVYWIGGFGDRAYIGWIPVEEWKNVTRAEWEVIRLPGEKKGWKEWSVPSEEFDL